MYGVVNRAIEEMVRSGYGDQVWERICARAGVTEDVFIGTDSYPDEMTYKLVGAACEELQLEASVVLQAFGRHWVQYTANGTYRTLLSAGGSNLRDFLVNLPNFHTRVHMMFPHLQPPRFEVTDVDAQGLTLHYFTHRAGLSHFVIGLLAGLGEHFATPVQVEHTQRREAGADHDCFSVRW